MMSLLLGGRYLMSLLVPEIHGMTTRTSMRELDDGTRSI